MIKPIDIQVVIKNIDHVAKINKVHEQALAGQQANAKDEMVKNVRYNMESVVQSNHSEKNSVNTNEKGKSEYSEDGQKKNSEKELAAIS